MDKEGIELLTHDKTLAEALRQPNVRRVIDELPEKPPSADAQKVQRSISQEMAKPAETEDSPLMQAVLTGLSWTTYAMAIGVTVFLAWVTASTLGR